MVVPYAVVVVTMDSVVRVGAPVILDGSVIIEAALSVVDADMAPTLELDDVWLLLPASAPPTPPPTAAAMMTMTTIAATIRNRFRGMPQMLFDGSAEVLFPV